MKTARCRKKCFDQIEGIVANNKELTTEVEDSQNQNLVIQLSKKEQERTSK